MLLASFSQYFFGISIFVLSVFLVLLVLVQRGRGGGLVGALGGPGGQSALGTKAGDLFTRITIVVAALWIFLCASAVRVLNPSNANPLSGMTTDSTVRPAGSVSAGIGDTSSQMPPAANAAPAAAVPANDKPAADQPSSEKPAEEKPAADNKAAEEKPAASSTEAAAQPAAPAATEPTTPAPAADPK